MLLRRFGLLPVLSAILALLLALATPAWPQTDPAVQAPPPEKVDQLIKLLADPSVKEWLAKQMQGANLPADPQQPANAGEMEQSMVSSTLDRIKAHLQRIVAAWPGLSTKFERAGHILMAEFANRGVWGLALIIAFFIGVGAGLAYIVYRLTRPLRLWTIALPHNTPQGRAKKLGGRLVFVLAMIGAFVLGSAGTFLAFDWPPLLREIVLAYLTAAIVIWIVRMLAGFVLLPPQFEVAQAQEVRALKMSDERAAHWYRWIVILAAVFSIVGGTFLLLPTFGFAQTTYWRWPCPPISCCLCWPLRPSC